MAEKDIIPREDLEMDEDIDIIGEGATSGTENIHNS